MSSLTFQHASSAAHTIPIHRGRTQTRQTLEVPIRTANRSSSASSTKSNMSSRLRGFYEHEEYERIEKVVLERIESLKRLNNPAYARKLKDCETRLEDVRYQLAKAHEKYMRQCEDDRAPGMGSSDDEEEATPKKLENEATAPVSIAVVTSDAADAKSTEKDDAPGALTNNNNDSAVSLHERSNSNGSERVQAARRNAIRMDAVPYLSAALLDCHATTDSNGSPYLTAQPTIVWDKVSHHWVEIRCNYCGAQSIEGEPIIGMAGMLNHIRQAHPSNSA